MVPGRIRIHQDQLGPTRRRRPAQEQSNGKQWNGRASLSEDRALADEECSQQEQALVDSAHRHCRGTEPTDSPWMNGWLGTVI